MMRISPALARISIAICFICWGLQHVLTGDFVTGRPPAIDDGTAQLLFTYLSGVLFIAFGISIITKWKISFFAVCAGGLILIWAGLRNIYALFVSLDYGFILTSTNKSLTLGFGAFLVASTIHNLNDTRSVFSKLVDQTAPLAKYFTGFFLLVSGIQHFLFVDFVKFLVPGWMPYPAFWAYFGGVALIAGGLGIMANLKRRLAALLSAWMVFIWFIILHLPRAIGATGNANEWTAVFEALAVSGFLFIIAYQTSVHE